MSIKKSLSVFAMVSVLCMIITVVCASHVETMTVSPSSSQLFWINLDDTDKVTGSFSISGGSGNDINFWITNPQGGKILDFGRVSQGTSFEFTAQVSGAYTLHFDNGFSLFSSKVVTLSYDAYRFGTTPTNPIGAFIWVILIVVVIGVLALIGLGIYVSLRRSRNKPPNPPSS